MILDVPIPSQHFAHIICMGKAWKSLIQTWKVKRSSKPFAFWHRLGGVRNLTWQEAVSGCHLKKLHQLLIATRFLLLFWQVWCRNTNNKRFVASCQLDTTILHESCWKPNTGDKTCQTVLIHPTFCWGNYTRIYQNRFYRSSNLTYFVQSHQAQVSQCFLPGSPWQQFASPSRNPFEWIWQKRDAPWTPHGVSTPHGTWGGHPTLNRDSIANGR